MHTLQDIQASEKNPGLPHVCVVDGRVWFSESALMDIETFTGLKPPGDGLLANLEFLGTQSVILQGNTFSADTRNMNWHGYVLMRMLQHAIETKAFGYEIAGELPDSDTFHADFMQESTPVGDFRLH